MDCGTCVLMGMCMLCGPGFGAAEPGRPLTEAEVMTAFDNMFVLLGENVRQKATLPPNIRNTRRHGPDVKYTSLGIGKRNPHAIDTFSLSLGDDTADVGLFDHDSRSMEESSSEIKDPQDAVLHKSSEDSGTALDVSDSEIDSMEGQRTLSTLPVSQRSQSMLGLEAGRNTKGRLLDRNNAFLDKEVKELLARRYRHSPVFKLLGLFR